MKLTKTGATRKILRAIQVIHEQKSTLKYSHEEQERWKALHADQILLDRALFLVLKWS